jgi:hydrogenase maturation protease
MAGGKRVTVVGCGRCDRGDDGVGLRIAEALAERDLPGTRVVLSETPGVDLLTEMPGADLFVIVDAARATDHHPTGSWERIDYRSFSGSLVLDRGRSSHGMSIADALALAEQLGELPRRVRIYALFGERFDLGSELSAEAHAAIPEVIAAIESEIRRPCTN